MIDKELCDRLKEIRNQLGLTQGDFAKKVGTNQAHISRIENYSLEPTKAIIKELIQKLNIDANWLLTGEGTMVRIETPELVFIFEVLMAIDISGEKLFNMLKALFPEKLKKYEYPKRDGE
jgi:transcriptional regulator with XRE-family HTH domain